MSATSPWERVQVTPYSGTEVVAVASDGSEWVGVGRRLVSGTLYASVAITDDPSTEWPISNLLDAGSPVTGFVPHAIGYGGGRYVAVGNSTPGVSDAVVYASENPSNSWSYVASYSHASGQYGTSVVSNGAGWAFITNRGELYTTTGNPIGGSWTMAKDFGEPKDVDGALVAFQNDEWVVVYRTTNPSNELILEAWATDDPNGTWTDLGSFAPTYGVIPATVGVSSDGYYYVSVLSELFVKATTGGSWSLAKEFKTSDLTSGPGGSTELIANVVHDDDTWVAVGAQNLVLPFVLTADSPSGPYVQRASLSVPDATQTRYTYPPVFSEDVWVAPLISGDGNLMVSNDATGGTGWGVLL